MKLEPTKSLPSSHPSNVGPGHALGFLVSRQRRQLQLTQAELAKRCGMPRAYLHRLCQDGVANPGVLTLHRLAQGLEMPTAALVRLWVDAVECPLSQHLTFEGMNEPADRMMFLADVTIPDHALVMPGERFTKKWAIQNVGSVPWPARRLVRCDAELVIAKQDKSGNLKPMLNAHLNSLDRAVDVPPAAPGAMVEISVEFAAPSENCSVASVWRLETLQGQPCYQDRCFLQVIVTVQGA